MNYLYKSPLILFAFTFLLVSCQTAKPVRNDEIVGLPPTEKEDPFFFVTLPAEATEAQTSGTIGDGHKTKGSAAQKKEGLSSNITPTRIQCFSCIKICAEGSSCSDADSICGWGVDVDRESATLRATAECDGALELARKDPQWKKIAGHCPIATCR